MKNKAIYTIASQPQKIDAFCKSGRNDALGGRMIGLTLSHPLFEIHGNAIKLAVNAIRASTVKIFWDLLIGSGSWGHKWI